MCCALNPLCVCVCVRVRGVSGHGVSGHTIKKKIIKKIMIGLFGVYSHAHKKENHSHYKVERVEYK